MAEFLDPRWQTGAGPLTRYVVKPTTDFMRVEAAGGIVLVLAAAAALIWANFFGDSYAEFWHTEIVADLGLLTLGESLHDWVNDALMAIFFFVVGLEIKREAVHGELRDRRQAALPILAALGGMVVPASVYAAFNAGGPGGAGWGIPVATDIAFALGVLSLLGNRVPIQLKVFLLTLAVADDVGGILIIAVFYAEQVSLLWLLGAGVTIGVILAMQRYGVRLIRAYLPVGFVLWLCIFESGVEATIGGVILGLLTPANALVSRERFGVSMAQMLERFHAAMGRGPLEDPRPTPDAPARAGMHPGELAERELREDLTEEVVHGMGALVRETQSPLHRVEHGVGPWSAFVVVPIFALANSGILLTGEAISGALRSDVAWGVAAGLLLGKLVGVLLFSYVTVRLGISDLPDGVRWGHVAGVALLAGIGFTVSIFIATLSFSDAQLVEEAKIGIFAATIIAAVLGYLALRLLPPSTLDEDPDGERSTL
ncbi:MAG: Na+/H+ antiporter NhaA [Chloroflexota bacterium]|nr:Na+/H+ antiporter NhaA [Chloroflexota bacterium]MXY79458.1 Na+/H+ antiporter NhaA [Chloroflexota bacterium]